MKTIRLILMAALAMMSALAIHADDNIGLQGSGTWDDPYLINNCEDLMTLSHATNELGLDFAGKTLMLTSDIYIGFDVSFAPISSHAETPFRGVIDGNKHSIGGWKVDTRDAGYSTEAMTETPTALVVYLGEEGAILNLTIDESCSFTARGYLAPLAYDVQGTVSHCINRADIYADHEVGGLVYRVGSTGRVDDCFNEGAITGAQRGFVGGIAARNNGLVARSQNTGMLKGSIYAQLGGIVGENSGGVSNCLSNGLLNGGSVIGGIVATAMPGSEVNSSLCTAVIWPGRLKDRVGAIAGVVETADKVKFSDNCFDRQICIYDNISDDGIKGVDTQQLIDTIWSGSRAWTKQEGMYPQLWTFHQERTSILGAATIVFKHGDTRLTMSAPAKLYHNLTDSFWWTLDGDEAFYLDDEGRLVVKPCDHDVSTILYANHGRKFRFIPVTALATQVDINDVNMVINLILDLDIDNPDYNGDINGDGAVDIDDVNMLINQILAQ